MYLSILDKETNDLYIKATFALEEHSPVTSQEIL